ncbi:MAG: hypothetical protein QM539_07955 [Alphaproteobacteria bacterium]|nr:hypothetical protein [Alphaproteobacteria bacterium]
MNTKKIMALFFSYAFHPIILPLYFYIIYITHFPQDFDMLSRPDFIYGRLISLIFNTVLYPLFAMFLLLKLKFINSLQMESQRERIIPIIIIMFFYWWMFKLYRDFPEHNRILKAFFFGCFLQTIWALLVNSFTKISLHSMGISAFATSFIILLLKHGFFLWVGLVVILFLIVAVVFSRWYLKKHSKRQLILGLCSGIVFQCLAFLIFR